MEKSVRKIKPSLRNVVFHTELVNEGNAVPSFRVACTVLCPVEPGPSERLGRAPRGSGCKGPVPAVRGKEGAPHHPIGEPRQQQGAASAVLRPAPPSNRRVQVLLSVASAAARDLSDQRPGPWLHAPQLSI